MPITVVILIGLFLVQRRGTGGIGAVFGPIMLVWFVAIARARAAARSLTHPASSAAINPVHGVCASSRRTDCGGFLVLGAVFLVGHRRRGALRRHGALRPAADPARLVRARAAGAAAQLLRPGRAAAVATPRRVENPFYLLAPALGALPAGGARDDRHGHRVAGADLRRVLAHAAGDAARLLAARSTSSTPRRTRPGRSTSPRSTGR